MARTMTGKLDCQKRTVSKNIRPTFERLKVAWQWNLPCVLEKTGTLIKIGWEQRGKQAASCGGQPIVPPNVLQASARAMDLSIGKSVQSRNVIAVKVREDNMPHFRWIVTESLALACGIPARGNLHGCRQTIEQLREVAGCLQECRIIAGVEQDRAFLRMDQQHRD